MLNQIRRTTDCKAELRISNKAVVKFNLVDVHKVSMYKWDFCDGEVVTLINDRLITLKDVCKSSVILSKKSAIATESFKYSKIRLEPNRNRWIVTCKKGGKRKEYTFSNNKYPDAERVAKSRQRVIENLMK